MDKLIVIVGVFMISLWIITIYMKDPFVFNICILCFTLMLIGRLDH